MLFIPPGIPTSTPLPSHLTLLLHYSLLTLYTTVLCLPSFETHPSGPLLIP